MQLKRTVSLAIGGLWGDEASGDDDDVLVARVADFDYATLRVGGVSTVRSIPQRLQRDRLLRHGDLLIEKSGGGDQQNVGRVVEWDGGSPAVSSNFINVLRPAAGFDSRFLTYLHRSLYLVGHAAACTKQTTGIQNLDLGAYLNTEVAIPDQTRQQAIAAFLDRESERIAELGAELAASAAAVTDGYIGLLRRSVLNGGYPLVPLKFFAATGTGHTPSRQHPEYWNPDDCVVPWFTLADVHQIRDGLRDIVSDTTEHISEVGIANSSAVKHPAGTVLLSRTASVGFAAVMGTEMAVSQDFMTWTCRAQLEPHYLLVALRAMQPELRGLMYGSTHKTIYMPDLHALRVPLPTLEDQRSIVARAERASRAAGAVQHEIVGLIRQLAEYRDALITEAVSDRLDFSRLSETQLPESLAAVHAGGPPEVLTR